MVKSKKLHKKQPTNLKKTKSKKNLLSSATETNLEIVPWSSNQEWDKVCQCFHEGNYNQVISEILVWKERVPALPVGVETTLFVLEAISYDGLRFTAESNHSDDQARSLYSLALIRYLNHVGHFSAFSLGETSKLPTKELASQVGTPDWLVTLRNEVSHGTTTPSTESLRLAGEFIIKWLKEWYWKHPEFTPFVESPTAEDVPIVEIQEPILMTQILSAFIAARIYSLRGINVIEDPELTKCIKLRSARLNSKTVITELQSRIKDFINNKSNPMCCVIAKEMVPNEEFYKDFCRLFNTNDNEPFDQLITIWSPITAMLQKRSKILEVCSYLAELHICPEDGSNQFLSALWINELLKMHQEKSGDTYSHKLHNVLKKVMLAPNSSSKLFLPRLMKIIKGKLGDSKVRKLETLASIWTDSSYSEFSKNSKKIKTILKKGNFFDVDQIKISDCLSKSNSNVNLSALKGWNLDTRGSQFWSTVHIGTVF